ncbi:PxKF domain-containing protein [Microbispora sp. NPDC046933]|uniref:PxKF domain-containing protein n=1 Tax=Microbispora sp. NPDC046933 TaxID=3155618 RepID=UPI00340D713F
MGGRDGARGARRSFVAVLPAPHLRSGHVHRHGHGERRRRRLVFAAGSPASGQTSCSPGRTDSVEQTVTAGGSPLSYDAAQDQYTYVWKADKAWAGQCRRLVVTLADGTQHWALFAGTRMNHGEGAYVL